MAHIDWNKVALDYQKSSFNEEHVRNHARKNAEALLKNNIAFDGYTDDGCVKAAPLINMIRAIGRLFHAGPPKAPARLDSLHLGYWELETCVDESHFGRRYEESYVDKRSYRVKYKSTCVFTGKVVIRDSRWVLLEDGTLAFHLVTTCYQEYPYEYGPNNWSVIKMGSVSAFSTLEALHKTVEREWRVMTADDILLLDHKKQNAKHRRINRDDYDICERSHLADDKLLTGKKGNGCIKKLTALLKKHDL